MPHKRPTLSSSLPQRRMDKLRGNPGWQQYSLQKKCNILPSTPRLFSSILVNPRSQFPRSPRDQFNYDMGMVGSPPPHSYLNHLARLQPSLHRCLLICEIRRPPFLPRLYPHPKSHSPTFPDDLASKLVCTELG